VVVSQQIGCPHASNASTRMIIAAITSESDRTIFNRAGFILEIELHSRDKVDRR
jgi:hypothetical protein